jgi:peptide/nickel transport system substrate-binding protein
MKKSISILVSLMLVLSIVLAGCGKSTTNTENNGATVEGETTVDNSLTYAIASAPKGVFNPLIFDDVYDDAVVELVYSTLIKYDENHELVPNLAESFEISDDSKTVTFKLAADAKWHDGEAVTTEDVEFTLVSMMEPNYTGPRYGDVQYILGAEAYHNGETDTVEGINIVDETTIEITFKEVYAPALANFARRGIIPKHIWASIPIETWAEQVDLLHNPIGSGPFKMENYESGQYVELVANEDYFKDRAKLDKFIFKVVNEETAQAELTNGTVDIADISSMKSKDIQVLEDANVEILEYSGNLYQYMGFNLRNELFQDKNVRQAITQAINRQGMVEQLMEGHGSLINAPFTPDEWAYPDESTLNQYEYDPAAAKALLIEAGWEDKDGMLYKDGEPFKVTLKYPVGNSMRELSAPIIQANLKEIGIEVELLSMEFASLSEEVIANHDFDLFLLGWGLELEPDPARYWHSSVAFDNEGERGWNMEGFRNDQNDALLEAGVKTIDVSERKEIYNEWAQLMNEEAPAVFLYLPNKIKAYNPRVGGYKPVTGLDFLNVEDWYIQ